MLNVEINFCSVLFCNQSMHVRCRFEPHHRLSRFREREPLPLLLGIGTGFELDLHKQNCLFHLVLNSYRLSLHMENTTSNHL